MAFDLGNLLQQYSGHITAADPEGVGQAFKHMAGQVPSSALAQGVVAAFRAEDTPPFAQMVSQLFFHSDQVQRTALLNQLLDDVSPAMLTALEASVGHLLRQNGHPQLTPEQVAEIAPPQVAEIAATAEQHNPGVLERVATLFAQHPEVLNSLDSNSLKTALGKMANLH
jgi:hypothetical protein